MGIKLGQTPKSVTKLVKLDMPDGTKGVVRADYAYHTRKQAFEAVQSLSESAKDIDKQAEVDVSAVQLKSDAAVVDFLHRVLVGWDVEAELTRENIAQLVDEVADAGTALMSGFQEAMLQGRLGN